VCDVCQPDWITPMTQRIYGLLSLKQVADRLNRSYIFVWREVRRNRLTSYKLGGQYSVSEVDLENYMAARRQSALGERRTAK
jgi:excisionase family DNA binding protein